MVTTCIVQVPFWRSHGSCYSDSQRRARTISSILMPRDPFNKT